MDMVGEGGDRENSLFYMNKYILGIKPDGSPRTSLSYSGWDLWKRDRKAYRRRYYENEKPFETVETIFGKKLAELYETDDITMSHVKRYKNTEVVIEINIGGAKFNGRLDTFCPETFAFLDLKSGHLSNEGKVPWDKVKVAKHKQLDWYSWLVKRKYGKVKNLCHIIWLETAFKKKTTEFAGMTLEAQTRELQLTGKIKKFGRTIQEWQRKKVETEALLAVKEIHKDYEEYQRIGNGQVKSQEVSTQEKSV